MKPKYFFAYINQELLKRQFCFFNKVKKITTYLSANSFLFFVSIFITNGLNAQSQKPNIILILADDVGYKTLGVNSGKSYPTPNLDLLAQNGMNFTGCHASPLCSPSRAMLLTGKYNFRNYTKWAYLDRTQKTIGNLMKDAGYITACYGKWQFDGGDQSIRAFGFDHYCVWDAFEGAKKSGSASGDNSRYKSPKIYANAQYMSSNETQDKYGEDIFTDSVLNFIDSNKSSPFFIYYPMVLAHAPFSPTPEDTIAFAAKSIFNKNDTSFYASMIKYMDEKIGLIINKLKSTGIENNTLILYTSDNGSPKKIADYIDDDTLKDAVGKGTTLESGLAVPLIAYWPNTISQGSTNNNLIDFTDFFKTIAEVAGISISTDYSPLDGISFAPALTGNISTVRDWLFYHYEPHPNSNHSLKRWAQTSTYKLYDTTSSNQTRLFYNIKNDPKEKIPIPDSLLTYEEDSIKQNLFNVINNYLHQGYALLDKPVSISVTDSSAFITDSIIINGGSTITQCGIVYSTAHDPVLGSGNYTVDNFSSGKFQSYFSGLAANQTYYIRAYAINAAGVSYSKEISFTTLLNKPVATNAANVNADHFTANWNPLTLAAGYKLDVSTYPGFSTSSSLAVAEGFDNGITPPEGWTFSAKIVANTTKFGTASPSLQLKNTGKRIVTKLLAGPATQLSFWVKVLGTDAGSLLVEGFNGITWVTIENIINPESTPVIKTYNQFSTPLLSNNFIQFRFTYTKVNATILLDDINIVYNQITPSFVSGYENLTVQNNFQLVTGLTRTQTTIIVFAPLIRTEYQQIQMLFQLLRARHLQ